MTNQINYPICGNKSQEESTNRDGYHILCSKCGEFFISRTLKFNLYTQEFSTNLFWHILWKRFSNLFHILF